MKITSKIALVIAAIALLCAIGWNSKAARPSRTTWEYKAVTMWSFHADVPLTNLKQLNDLGDEGWEMVTVFSEEVVRANNTRHTKLTYFFKREV